MNETSGKLKLIIFEVGRMKDVEDPFSHTLHYS